MSTNSEEKIVSDKEVNEVNEVNEVKIELQLGDVIEIKNPINELINDKTFIIDYIDPTKILLTDTDSLNTIRLTISPEGIIGDGNITHISIISRNESRSYAEQNGLLPDKWINIYFGGEFHTIITGKITNLENDMIEIKSIDGDILYINFDYQGIPEDLPIELIEIREEPLQEKKEEPIEKESLPEEPLIEEELVIPELEVEKKERLLILFNSLFAETYFSNTLKIPSDYIKGFQYYCIEDGKFSEALKSKNKTKIEFLIVPLATKYKKIIANENE